MHTAIKPYTVYNPRPPGTYISILNCFSPQVPAKDLVERAVASRKDGDVLCSTGQMLACASKKHAEEEVFKALWDNHLLARAPFTHLDLGEGLEKHPCLHPEDLIISLIARGKFEHIIGFPLEDCDLASLSTPVPFALSGNFLIASYVPYAIR